MGNNRGCPLPKHTSDAQLASDFSHFFTTKVSMIRDSLCHEDTSYLTTPTDDSVQVTLDTFVSTTNEETIGIIKSLPDKSCKLDPIPVMVCQCKCIERHMQSKRSVLEDDETRGRSVLSLSLLVIVIK